MWTAIKKPTGLALIVFGLAVAGVGRSPETLLTAADPSRRPLLGSGARGQLPRGSAEKSDPSDESGDSITDKMKRVVGLGPNQARAQQRLQEAESQFQAAVALRQQGEEAPSRKKFEAAAEKYWSAAKRWPQPPLEEDALYWAGEAYFFADEYPKATKAYSALIKEYPNTKHMDRVTARQFAIAEYWLQLNKKNPNWIITPNLTNNQRPRFDTFGHAIKVFDAIRFDDPTGRLSDDATMAAANASFTAGKYARADMLYSDLRDSFPDSDHQFNAHLLGIKCKMLTYEGPDYDGTVLDEAEDLIKRMVRIFPNESQQHRANLEKAMGDIRLQKAQRQWRRAKYYDRRKEFGAARYYYNVVQREYHDTNLAAEARQRLAQIGGLPSDPPQRLAWLAELFPDPEKQAKPLIARDHVDTQSR